MELLCQSILKVIIYFRFLAFGVTDYVSVSRDMPLHYGAVPAKAP